MQIVHRILSVLLVIVGIFLTIIGVTTPSETTFTHTEVILSPVQVVWPVLTDPERMTLWQTGMEKIKAEQKGDLKEGTILLGYAREYDPGFYHEDKIIRITPEKNFTLMRLISKRNTVIRDYSQSYELKRLRDGTTELTCRIFYRCPGFISRIYNRLYKQKRIETSVRGSIRRLKTLIEQI